MIRPMADENPNLQCLLELEAKRGKEIGLARGYAAGAVLLGLHAAQDIVPPWWVAAAVAVIALLTYVIARSM